MNSVQFLKAKYSAHLHIILWQTYKQVGKGGGKKKNIVYLSVDISQEHSGFYRLLLLSVWTLAFHCQPSILIGSVHFLSLSLPGAHTHAHAHTLHYVSYLDPLCGVNKPRSRQTVTLLLELFTYLDPRSLISNAAILDPIVISSTVSLTLFLLLLLCLCKRIVQELLSQTVAEIKAQSFHFCCTNK